MKTVEDDRLMNRQQQLADAYLRLSKAERALETAKRDHLDAVGKTADAVQVFRGEKMGATMPIRDAADALEAAKVAEIRTAAARDNAENEKEKAEAQIVSITTAIKFKAMDDPHGHVA